MRVESKGAIGILVVVMLAACGMNDEKAARQYCELIIECDPRTEAFYDGDVRECADDVVYDLMDMDEHAPAGCADAIRGLVYCLASLETCQDHDDYWSEPTPDYPCHQEDARVYRRCW